MEVIEAKTDLLMASATSNNCDYIGFSQSLQEVICSLCVLILNDGIEVIGVQQPQREVRTLC